MMYSPRYDVHLNTLEFVSSVVSSNIILSLWTQDRIQYGVGFQYLTCKTISYKTYTNLYCNRFEEPKINFVHSLWKRIEKHSYKNFIPLASFSHNFLAYLHWIFLVVCHNEKYIVQHLWSSRKQLTCLTSPSKSHMALQCDKRSQLHMLSYLFVSTFSNCEHVVDY